MKERSLEDLFQQVDDELNTAYEGNDAGAIARVLSDDWILLEPHFGIISRERFLRSVREGRLVHSKMKKVVVHARVYGDIAVVISRGQNVGQLEGMRFDAEQWVTNTYRKTNESWVCVMSQEAPVS